MLELMKSLQTISKSTQSTDGCSRLISKEEKETCEETTPSEQANDERVDLTPMQQLFGSDCLEAVGPDSVEIRNLRAVRDDFSCSNR